MFDNLTNAINDIYDAAYESECPKTCMDAVDELYDLYKNIKAIEFMQVNTLGNMDCAIGLDDDLCELEDHLKKAAKEALRLSRLLEIETQELMNAELYDKGRFEYMHTRGV